MLVAVEGYVWCTSVISSLWLSMYWTIGFSRLLVSLNGQLGSQWINVVAYHIERLA
jgi:hypothetical protein